MIDNLQYTQQSVISILNIKNEYLEKMAIKPEELDMPYRKFLSLFISSYSKYKIINLDYVMSRLTIDEQMQLLDIMSDMTSATYSYFVSLQKIIQERSIQRELHENIRKYENEEISLDELRTRMTIESSSDVELLTEKELIETLTTEQKVIDFVGFSRTRSLLNLRETDLCVIAAYTGKGKTALALNFMEDLSKNYDIVYVNLEMGIASLRKRMMSIHSGVKIRDLERYNFLNQSQKNEILKKVKFINERKIEVTKGSQSIDTLRELIASKGNKHTVYVIDHIGLLHAEGRSLYEKMTQVAKELRKMSLDYNATIIALCQLSRQGAKGKPDLSMLRDSGEIEQSATKVMFLYSEESIDGEDYFISIAKNRDGMTGRIAIRFDKATQIISEVE